MFTLVPSDFFDPAKERQALSKVALLEEGQSVRHAEVPQYSATLIYTIDEGSASFSAPPILPLLKRLPLCPEYNKILCHIEGGVLYIAIAQGKNLLLANRFEAPDFTTVQYYIFACVKSLQINPEISTISWTSHLEPAEQMSLYRYFKSVESLV